MSLSDAMHESHILHSWEGGLKLTFCALFTFQRLEEIYYGCHVGKNVVVSPLHIFSFSASTYFLSLSSCTSNTLLSSILVILGLCSHPHCHLQSPLHTTYSPSSYLVACRIPILLQRLITALITLRDC